MGGAQLDPDPLDLIERDLVVAPVVEAGRPGRLMSGHLLGNLQLAAIPQISRDAGGTKGVAADFGLDAGRERPPANHPPHIGLEQGIAGELTGSAPSRAEERLFPVLGDAGRGDVLLQIAVEIVVGVRIPVEVGQ